MLAMPVTVPLREKGANYGVAETCRTVADEPVHDEETSPLQALS